jgi:predicted transcriptional regulator
MGRKRNLQKPTEAEWSILRVLWNRGPSTVREIWEGLPGRRAKGYTTVLKLLQIMHGKGLVRRDESKRSHVYIARVSEEQAQHGLVGDLLDRVFGGSAAQLVLRALHARRTSPEDLATIRRLLAEQEGDRK